MGLLSKEVVALPTWSLGEVEEALLNRRRGATLAETERSSWSRKPKEEGPCWWILSVIDSFEGKEAREAYYAML